MVRTVSVNFEMLGTNSSAQDNLQLGEVGIHCGKAIISNCKHHIYSNLAVQH